MENTMVRNVIRDTIAQIIPHDELEQTHIEDTLAWIESGAEIFRIRKDATPPKHLVSYSVVVDIDAEKILLFDHKSALKLLPSGGHIDMNELPADAAVRELSEELGLSLPILSPKEANPDIPFFITVTRTGGMNEPHTDVSCWYLFRFDSNRAFDGGADFAHEFDGYHWLSYGEILSTPIERLDPNLHRFVQKLEKAF